MTGICCIRCHKSECTCPVHLRGGPQTKAQLWRSMVSIIENEGLDYGLVQYTSPESQNADILDPKLATLWNEYLELVKKIEAHVGVTS